MKTLRNIIMFATIALLAVNCKNDTKPEVKTISVEAIEDGKELDPNATYAKAEFNIDGMTCEIGCARTIQKKLAKMEGVKSATVDFKRELAMVEYDNAKVTPLDLEETVIKVADIYKVSDMKTVEEFSKEETLTGKKICDKDCCAGKTDEEKANCKMKCCAETASNEMKKPCSKDCKKACCSKEEKV